MEYFIVSRLLDQVPAGVSIGGKETNSTMHSKGRHTCLYMKLGVCRVPGGGCGQGGKKKGPKN